MSNGTTAADAAPKTQAIWLLLLREGGRWSAAEMAERLSCESSFRITPFICQMARRGYLARYPLGGQKFQYAVTKDCKIPQGLELRDLIEAGGVA